MEMLLDFIVALISLAFLIILGVISGMASPGVCIAAAAPWLDGALPFRRQ